jgi:predicted  nucleic acid-binding Zn-ribbon protein
MSGVRNPQRPPDLKQLNILHLPSQGGVMKANPSDQRQILDIQNFDFTTATLKNKAANLLEIAEINKLTIRANNARDLRIAAQTEASDVQRELTRAEGDVEQVVTRITRDEARLNSGTGSAKDLEGLTHEVETLNKRRAELEEVELEIMMRMDSIKERITTLEKEEADLAAQIADLEIKKENALTLINSDIEKIAQDRSETTKSVDAALLELYEKIRTGGGSGAAPLKGGQCGGCHLSINAVELKRILDLSEDEVVRCEECRCILVRGV